MMVLKDILVIEPSERADGPVLDAAAFLASRYHARVNGLCLVAPPIPSVAECFALGAEAEAEVMQHLELREDEAADAGEKAFKAKLLQYGASGDWARIRADQGEDLAPLRARLADLTIAPRPDRLDPHGIRLADALLLRASAPSLFIPPALAIPIALDRAVIAWNGSREVARAVSDALPLLKRAGTVRVITFGRPPGSSVCGAAALRARLWQHDIAAEVRHADIHDAGKGILDICEAFEANLLIMGAYGHNRRVEATFGGTTRHVLLNAPLPVFMSH
ncbi:universal stress protein [Sphingomonas lycopersici]|uniref:Universal stress protein n=1 Tax=Sphingomonas lycopersici TaxID=2951807 RepID=A0AA42CRD8_9SPHN|nr:universal stress protein [Sphingomonas lycopersici]MCW6535982.1 universal stress protein [Sphingomonas lycopersici]